MKNIAIPGVFPFVIALLLALTAFRAHVSAKVSVDKRYAFSKILCIFGVFIFTLIAIFQILEASGILYQ